MPDVLGALESINDVAQQIEGVGDHGAAARLRSAVAVIAKTLEPGEVDDALAYAEEYAATLVSLNTRRKLDGARVHRQDAALTALVFACLDIARSTRQEAAGARFASVIDRIEIKGGYYRRPGDPCRSCGTPLVDGSEHSKAGQRVGAICPDCGEAWPPAPAMPDLDSSCGP